MFENMRERDGWQMDRLFGCGYFSAALFRECFVVGKRKFGRAIFFTALLSILHMIPTSLENRVKHTYICANMRMQIHWGRLRNSNYRADFFFIRIIFFFFADGTSKAIHWRCERSFCSRHSTSTIQFCTKLRTAGMAGETKEWKVKRRQEDLNAKSGHWTIKKLNDILWKLVVDSCFEKKPY